MPCVGCRVAQASIAGGDHDLLLRRRRAMEHKPRVDLQEIADLSPVESRAPMSREERLARWVEALQREPKRILRPLHGIEFRKPDERRAIRADNSPLTVAYEDRVLRSEGLASDQLGDGSCPVAWCSWGGPPPSQAWPGRSGCHGWQADERII